MEPSTSYAAHGISVRGAVHGVGLGDSYVSYQQRGASEAGSASSHLYLSIRTLSSPSVSDDGSSSSGSNSSNGSFTNSFPRRRRSSCTGESDEEDRILDSDADTFSEDLEPWLAAAMNSAAACAPVWCSSEPANTCVDVSDTLAGQLPYACTMLKQFAAAQPATRSNRRWSSWSPRGPSWLSALPCVLEEDDELELTHCASATFTDAQFSL